MRNSIEGLFKKTKDGGKKILTTTLIAGMGLIPLKGQAQDAESGQLKRFDEIPQLFQRTDQTGHAHMEVNNSNDADAPFYIVFNLDKATPEDIDNFIVKTKDNIESLRQQISALEKCAACQDELEPLRAIMAKTEAFLSILNSKRPSITASSNNTPGTN